MAKYTIIAVSALCFVALFGTALSVEKLYIEGQVYCDTCRTQFPTRISENIPNATVCVECREENGTITFNKHAMANEQGFYMVEVEGDHEEEVCEVRLVQSTRPDCNQIDTESHLEQAARVSITRNNGIVSSSRTANPLGFLIKERLPECAQVFKELGLDADGHGASDSNDGNDDPMPDANAASDSNDGNDRK